MNFGDQLTHVVIGGNLDGRLGEQKPDRSAGDLFVVQQRRTAEADLQNKLQFVQFGFDFVADRPVIFGAAKVDDGQQQVDRDEGDRKSDGRHVRFAHTCDQR